MAELGLGLALYGATGSTVELSKLAKLAVDRIKCFRHASSVLHDLKTFGYDLSDGQLHLSVQLVEDYIINAAASGKNEEERKFVAKRHLEKLRAGLLEAREILDKSVDVDGQVNRWYFTFKGERELKRILNELSRCQSDFNMFTIVAELRREISPRDMLLTPHRFCLTTQNNRGFMGLPLDSAPHVRLASAEYKDEAGIITETDVLIEPQNISRAQDTTALLARHLGKNWTTGGVLQCLGFLTDPSLELVFRIPSNLKNPRSLKSLIARKNGNESASKPTIHSRLSLAMALLEAVISVHSTRLVHKTIQPETILLFEKWDEDKTQCNGETCNGETSLGVPILTAWSMSRKTDELSSREGEDDWMKNIYRHPQRQGLQLEKRYHMGHDLYSLGVCLIELGLWEPLITAENDHPPKMSDRYCDMAWRTKSINPEEVGALKRLVKPTVVQEIMIGLAEHDLGQEMGEAFSQVVLACFQNVEALGASDKLGDDSDVPMMYHKQIIQPLSEILFQSGKPPAR